MNLHIQSFLFTPNFQKNTTTTLYVPLCMYRIFLCFNINIILSAKMSTQCQRRKHLKIITGDQRLFLEKRIVTENGISSSTIIYILFSWPKGLSNSSSFKGLHSFKELILCTRVKLQDPLHRIPVMLGGYYLPQFRTWVYIILFS